MDAAARTRAAQRAAWHERERQNVWWSAYRESRSMGIPQADARDRADTMLVAFDREHAANGGAAVLRLTGPRTEERITMKRVAKNLGELAQYFEQKAQTEDTWKERARSAVDKRRAEIRAEAFREVAADIGQTELDGNAA